MVVIIVLNFLFLLLSIILTIRTKDNLFTISSILFFMGTFFILMGAMEDYKKNDSIKKHNINPDVMEYIISIRNQNDETSITTDNAIAVYLECKRNGFNEEETISFLLPDITKEEAKSIVKTYNLLEKEN